MESKNTTLYRESQCTQSLIKIAAKLLPEGATWSLYAAVPGAALLPNRAANGCASGDRALRRTTVWLMLLFAEEAQVIARLWALECVCRGRGSCFLCTSETYRVEQLFSLGGGKGMCEE